MIVLLCAPVVDEPFDPAVSVGNGESSTRTSAIEPPAASRLARNGRIPSAVASITSGPRRVNVWQHTLPEQGYREGFNNFRWGRDGRRMAFAARTQVDPTKSPGDNMEFYSASIPIQPWEPLFENVNSDRSIACLFGGAGNSVLFITPQQLVPEDNNGPGFDVYLRVFR